MVDKPSGKTFRWLIDANIPHELRSDERDVMRSRVLVAVILGLIVVEVVLLCLVGLVVDLSPAGGTLAYNILTFIITASLASLVIFRLIQRRAVAANFLGLSLWFAMGYAVWHTGGMVSVVLPVYLLLPIFIVATIGGRWGIGWIPFILATFVAFLVANNLGFQFPQLMDLDNYSLVRVICLGATSLLVVIVIVQYETATMRMSHELRRERTHLDQLARSDQLTGLSNRRHFAEELDKAISRARRNENHFALLFFDLNEFKAVNDNYGHAAGDELLKTIAQRMLNRIRNTDSLARWGGDEFAMVLENVNTDADVQRVVGDLCAETRKPVTLDGAAVSVNVSIGVAMYPDDGSDSEELVHVADQAMYDVKAKSKGGGFAAQLAT